MKAHTYYSTKYYGTGTSICLIGTYAYVVELHGSKIACCVSYNFAMLGSIYTYMYTITQNFGSR